MRTTPIHCSSLAVLFFLLLRGAVAYADASAYEVIDLGADFTVTNARGLNNLGQVVGDMTSDGSTHAFVSSPYGSLFKDIGNIQDIGTLGGSNSIAHGINDSGIVVGESTTSTGATHAFVISPGGSLQDINGATNIGSIAYGINNAGQITGLVSDQSSSGAFIRGANGGAIIKIGGSLFSSSIGYGINAFGQVAGEGNGTAFLTGANGSSPASLGSFDPVIPSSTAYGVNDNGVVVGSSRTVNGEIHAFITNGAGAGLFDPGTFGGPKTFAYGINNRKNANSDPDPQVVGQSDTHSFTGLSTSTNPHAFVWDATNGLTDLNQMVDADTGQIIGNKGITLTSAAAINDQGQIVANGGYRGELLTVPHAFLLTPKPMSGKGKNLGLAPSDFPPIEAHRQASGGAINVATGNVILVETDYVGGASSGLILRRYYNSQSRGTTIFGAKWRSTYDRTIGKPVNNRVLATRADGRVEVFTLNNGAWNGDPDETDSLKALTDTSGNPNGWQLVTIDDTTETYNTDGRLTEIKTRAGLKTSLSYDDQGI